MSITFNILTIYNTYFDKKLLSVLGHGKDQLTYPGAWDTGNGVANPCTSECVRDMRHSVYCVHIKVSKEGDKNGGATTLGVRIRILNTTEVSRPHYTKTNEGYCDTEEIWRARYPILGYYGFNSMEQL